MKLALYGAAGRMGRAVTRLACQAQDITIVGAVEQHDSPTVDRDVGEVAGVGDLGVAISADLASALLGADVLIDFSIAGVFDGMLRGAMQAGVPVVSGTTRLSADSEALIDKAAERIAVLWAPNMSVAVQLVARLVQQAVAALGSAYDVEIVEAHHNNKADAPSGTAVFLQQAAQAAREELKPVFGREGQTGARQRQELGVHAIRGGSVVGDHHVHLLGDFDRIEITHRAIGRELFAAGALRAARYLAARPPGRYALADILD